MGQNVDKEIQKLLGMWNTGDLPKMIKKTMLSRRSGERPCDMWSLSNQILMILGGTEDARGFKQWDEAGRKIKKGCKAIYISGPLKKMIEVEDDETKQKVKQTVIYGFKDIPVFRIEDTEGEAISTKRPDYMPPVLPPLMEVAEAWDIPVTYTAGNGKYYGVYKHTPGRSIEQIVLNTHDASTFFHELSHAAHNRIRPLKGGQDPTQEIVAETCAAVLCLMYGYEEYVGHSRDYVAHYGHVTPSEATKAVMRALSDIEKVINLILETAESVKARTA